MLNDIENEKLYKNAADFNALGWHWPHFSVSELKCKCVTHCQGEYYHYPRFLDALEKMRTILNAPLVINSGHRCAIHNKKVGGASKSMHTQSLAVDIKITSHGRKAIYEAVIQCGFTGLGFGVNFIHLDMGRRRRWDYPNAIKLWKQELGYNPLYK